MVSLINNVSLIKDESHASLRRRMDRREGPDHQRISFLPSRHLGLGCVYKCTLKKQRTKPSAAVLVFRLNIIISINIENRRIQWMFLCTPGTHTNLNNDKQLRLKSRSARRQYLMSLGQVGRPWVIGHHSGMSLPRTSPDRSRVSQPSEWRLTSSWGVWWWW